MAVFPVARGLPKAVAVTPAFVLIIALILCPIGQAGDKRVTYKQPFSLQDRGIGSNPVEGELVLRAEEEQPFVSRALLHTLQEFQLSVADRSQNAAEPLLPRHDYKTDVAPIGDEDVRKYNAVHTGPLALDSSLNFGLQYEVRYEIQVERDRFFFFQIESTLYARGAATSSWRQYKGSYSGNFFANRFVD